jgi:hypothetical protein
MSDVRSMAPLSRRVFLRRTGRVGVAVGVLGAGGLLSACGGGTESSAEGAASRAEGAAGSPSSPAPAAAASPSTAAAAGVDAQAIVGDVLDFALTSDDWEGEFGFVEFRLHRGHVDGEDVYVIRTDTSDEEFASETGMLVVPKLATLTGTDLVGRAVVIDAGADGQGIVFSSEPGRDDFTPACQIQRASFSGDATLLTSIADVDAAADEGTLTLTDTDIVANMPFIAWSNGALPVDDERTAYLGPGQLLAEPDTDAMTVRFKLHECYPNVRYIVTDVELAPMAEGMAVGHSPAFAGASEAGATGRTNVFMNGVDGPGPMGFQPSVFDTQAGDPEWSPYWDHLTYAWADGVEPRVLTTEDDVHAARDAGDLEEFSGTPDTGGETFVVNCPVPVLADNTFEA